MCNPSGHDQEVTLDHPNQLLHINNIQYFFSSKFIWHYFHKQSITVHHGVQISIFNCNFAYSCSNQNHRSSALLTVDPKDDRTHCFQEKRLGPSWNTCPKHKSLTDFSIVPSRILIRSLCNWYSTLLHNFWNDNIQQWCTMCFSALISWFVGNFKFVPDFRQIARPKFLKFFFPILLLQLQVNCNDTVNYFFLQYDLQIFFGTTASRQSLDSFSFKIFQILTSDQFFYMSNSSESKK